MSQRSDPPADADPNAPFRGRPEDERLLRGQGLFVADHTTPGLLHLAFVRSPHARARIVSIDAGAAEARTGVRCVRTGAHWPAAVLPPPNPVIAGVQAPAQPLLARGEVRYLGEPVALVVADSPSQAREAADEVWVDYEPLPAATDSVTVARTGWTLDSAAGRTEATAAPLEATAGPPEGTAAPNVPVHTVHLRHEQALCAPMALEPRGCVMRWDADTQRLTAWLATQAPARSRDDLARTLGLPAAQVRVVLADVGGAFGGKASLYPEDHACALVARELAAAVSWTSSRSDDFVAATHGRGARLEASLSADASGRFTGLRARVRVGLGAWLPYSGLVPVRNATRILPGPYRVAGGRVEGEAYVSNHAPVNIYRGAGRPEAALVMEVLVEKLARAARIDPLELRRRNLVAAGDLPLRLPGGDTLDSSDFSRLLGEACRCFDYDGERALQRERRARGELVGIGCALYAEPCGQGFERARVSRRDDGRFEVATGSCSQGQGHSLAFARIAAQALGVDEADVAVVEGDTDHVPDGIGALASRSTAIGGSAVLQAARELAGRLAQGASGAQSVEVRYDAAREAWASGCVLVRLSIDAQTGEPRIERLVWADDAGRVVSPELTEGQMIGGLAQGLGQAFMERLVYDEHGQLLTGSLMDYAVPRADDMPAVELVSVPCASSANALGAKGVGEAGCIGAPAALLNAALDALAPLGVNDLDFPMTSERLWTALQSAPLELRRTR